jgi:hypothetical protein
MKTSIVAMATKCILTSLARGLRPHVPLHSDNLDRATQQLSAAQQLNARLQAKQLMGLAVHMPLDLCTKALLNIEPVGAIMCRENAQDRYVSSGYFSHQILTQVVQYLASAAAGENRQHCCPSCVLQHRAPDEGPRDRETRDHKNTSAGTTKAQHNNKAQEHIHRRQTTEGGATKAHKDTNTCPPNIVVPRVWRCMPQDAVPEHTIPDEVGREAGAEAMRLDEGAEACLAGLANPQHCGAPGRAKPFVAV